MTEAFDFTASFKNTLGRFESLGKSSKADYERTRLKKGGQLMTINAERNTRLAAETERNAARAERKYYKARAEAAEFEAESAYARGFHDAQTKARVEGKLVIVDSPELVELRAEIARLKELVQDRYGMLEAYSREIARLREATNQCRLAFAGYVDRQSAIDKLDALEDTP